MLLYMTSLDGMGSRVLVAYCSSHAFASKVTRLASLTSPNRRNVCIMKVLHQTCVRSELVIFFKQYMYTPVRGINHIISALAA